MAINLSIDPDPSNLDCNEVSEESLSGSVTIGGLSRYSGAVAAFDTNQNQGDRP